MPLNVYKKSLLLSLKSVTVSHHFVTQKTRMQRNYPGHNASVGGDEDSVVSEPDIDTSPRERMDSVAAWLQTPQRFRLADQYCV